jgi:serine/threonine protein kinase
MEYLPGRSLAERLKGGPLSSADAIATARRVVSAMAASHRAGIVHGDIKPANILFAEDGSVKVVDFGMARHVQPSAGDAVESRGGTLPPGVSVEPVEDDANSPICGTPAYMAPEQTRGAPPSFAADVFSTGLLLYEIFTGARATATGRPAEAFQRVRELDPRALSHRMPATYRAIWEHMLANEPQQRPSMTEVDAFFNSDK